MPSVSKKQHNTMEAAAHDKNFAKKMGIPQKVAKDFTKADAAQAKTRSTKKSSKKGRK